MTSMTLELNGEAKTVSQNSNIKNAIIEWGLTGEKFAIAVNEQFIPQAQYSDTILQAGDRVELLVPMQGG